MRLLSFLVLACHDLEINRWYEEGTSWNGDSDPCVSCQCRVGHLKGSGVTKKLI